MTARLVSVNVGMPKDVPWNGKTVHTGVWKTPVEGTAMVRRLNIDGDGQGDLAGHGGEQRAVMVYQTESYDYWQDYLGRDDLRPGNFGENFTVSGLDDHDVCIGDRYRIGDAEFEVTQPRVTCFRVGMRLGVPDMPNLLVSQHRPGFYFRVITEGLVRAGDDIVLTRRGRHELSVADVDALLYLPDRDMELLHKVVDVPALSPGWQQSFRDMLAADEKSSAPTQLSIGVSTGWRGFRRLCVTATHQESPTVLSILLEADDGGALPTPLPGQYLTVKIPGAGDPPPMRSYSLSGDPAAGYYRISVKREDRGQVSRWLHSHAGSGLVIESASPRGDFYLVDDASPVILVSAGIGATPVMAMAHALAAAKSPRQICGCIRHRAARRLRSPPRSRPCSTRCPTLISWSSTPVATTSQRASIGGRSPRSACRPTQRHTSAVPPGSWTTCVTPSPRPASIPRTSTANCSAHSRRSTRELSARRRPSDHILPRACRARGRRSRSPAAGSASTGRRASIPSLNSPKRATCPPGTHAGAASATPARPP